MIIYPAIDIRNGKCVRLYQGKFDKEKVYSDDPVEMALKWKKAGSKYLHIVDLDGARVGKPTNFKVIKKIIGVSKLSVQIGGGIRDIESINRYMEAGADKVILSSRILEDENFARSVPSGLIDKIAVSLDMLNGRPMIKGWKMKINMSMEELIEKVDDWNIKTLIITDISRDGTMTSPDYELIKPVRKLFKKKLIISGGISTMGQIEELKKTGINGVIIGKALYEGKINLREVIHVG